MICNIKGHLRSIPAVALKVKIIFSSPKSNDLASIVHGFIGSESQFQILIGLIVVGLNKGLILLDDGIDERLVLFLTEVIANLARDGTRWFGNRQVLPFIVNQFTIHRIDINAVFATTATDKADGDKVIEGSAPVTIRKHGTAHIRDAHAAKAVVICPSVSTSA